jgi:serine/threonine-protein kinase
LRHCLEKDPENRLDNIADATLQISDTLSKPLVASQPTISAKLQRVTMIVGAIVIVTLSAVGVWLALDKQTQPPSREIRLVVLPFDNLGPAAEGWFADGMTDEIRTRLGYIHGLDVIAKHSAIAYKKMGISPQIVKEHSLDYFLEGSVQCGRPSDPNSQVRIRIQLAKAADNALVWQQTFDGNMGNIFRLQIDIAEKVAQALDMSLLEPVRKATAHGYINNTEAYAYYIRGRQSFNTSKEGNAQAIKMYERAIELEPDYALAHALLSNALTQMYWSHGKNREFLPRAKAEVDRALKLAPDMPGAHVALGRYYYQGYFDYENALEQFAIARRSYPNHVWAIAWTAYAKTRQGKFEEALVDLLRATELDPVRLSFLNEIAFTYMFLRRYEESERYCERAIRLAPDKPDAHELKAWLYLLRRGDTAEARKVVDQAVLNNKELASDPWIIRVLVAADLYDREYEAALKKLIQNPEDLDNITWFIPGALRLAEVYRYMGKQERARQHYESAVDILKKKLDEDPDNSEIHRVHSSLGKAYARLGYKQEAIDEGLLGVKCPPVTKDAIIGSLREEDLARIYVMVGKYDEAIEKLEYLLSIPTRISKQCLKLDPVWDPLREHPDFPKLVEPGK